jgi:hypothetical protein
VTLKGEMRLVGVPCLSHVPAVPFVVRWDRNGMSDEVPVGMARDLPNDMGNGGRPAVSGAHVLVEWRLAATGARTGYPAPAAAYARAGFAVTRSMSLPISRRGDVAHSGPQNLSALPFRRQECVPHTAPERAT